MLLLAFSLTLNTKVTLGLSSIISVSNCISVLIGISIGDTTLRWFILLIALHLIPKAPDWKRKSCSTCCSCPSASVHALDELGS